MYWVSRTKLKAFYWITKMCSKPVTYIMFYFVVIFFFLPHYPKSTVKKIKAHKPLRTSRISQKFRPFLIIIKSCYFNCRINKPFACTRCSVFLSLFTWSRRITRAKDHRPFYLNYQQINGGRNSDHMLSVLPRLQRSNTSVLQAMMRIIPFLTFGDERNMRTLINHFLPFLDFEKYVPTWPPRSPCFFSLRLVVISSSDTTPRSLDPRRDVMSRPIARAQSSLGTKQK